MLIPLGILAASGDDFVDAYELIATAFGTGSSGTITFDSIPQDYKHLQIRYTAKNTSSSVRILIRMNGISSGVYIRHTLKGDLSSAESSSSTASRTEIEMFESMTTSSNANVAASGIIDLVDYSSTSKNTTLRALYGIIDSQLGINLLSGLYNQTTAVSSLSLLSSANNFATMSRFSLYGIRG